MVSKTMLMFFSKTLTIPWVRLITSKAVWGCVLGFLTYGLLFISLAICLPLYFEQVLELDPTLNGFVSALPFVGRIFGAILFGYISDWIFSRKWLSITNLRKVFQVTGLVGAAPFLIWITYLGKDDAVLAVILMVVYWFILTAMNSGFRVNFADIAPRFAGLLNGICMCLNGFISVFVPILVTAITPNGTAEEWQVVFYGCVGVSVMGAVVFVLLASGEEQEWAKDTEAISDVEVMVTSNNSKVYGSTTADTTPLVDNRGKHI
ncbi:sialin-like isoform X3 [Pecten maximus]|uniref:sialin-like isoform X3 n=1 Tax=Pecten maximus TaxID=6579 RepID=UPI0014587D35|nr:sialin-like isoform X3 [Pecten maximus]